MLKALLATVTGAFLLATVSPNQLQAKCDPLVGVWLQNQHVDGDPELVLAAQVIANADGTLHRNLDVDLQRVINSPLFPENTVFSISDDYSNWKRVSKHRYECLGTQILLIKTPDNTFVPLARAKCEIEFTLDGNSMTGTEKLTFFDYYDLTLTVPFVDLPELTFTIEGQKLVQ